PVRAASGNLFLSARRFPDSSCRVPSLRCPTPPAAILQWPAAAAYSARPSAILSLLPPQNRFAPHLHWFGRLRPRHARQMIGIGLQPPAPCLNIFPEV